MRVHGEEGAKWMNALFQWLVHGEVEDINDANSMHHNGHTIDNNKEELVHRKKQVRLYGQGYCSCSPGVVDLPITELWNTTKQGIGYTRLNGTSQFPTRQVIEKAFMRQEHSITEGYVLLPFHSTVLNSMNKE